MATSMPRATMPRLRYLLVLDFEATCDDTDKIVPKEEMEITEFPTILYDLHDDKVEAVFHEYVRPSLHPQLTKFCTDLTGIQQVCKHCVKHIGLNALTDSIAGHSGRCKSVSRRLGTVSAVPPFSQYPWR